MTRIFVYLTLIFTPACAVGLPIEGGTEGSLYGPCETPLDCDLYFADGCLKVRGKGICSAICREDSDCPFGTCRNDLIPEHGVCWPEK